MIHHRRFVSLAALVLGLSIGSGPVRAGDRPLSSLTTGVLPLDLPLLPTGPSPHPDPVPASARNRIASLVNVMNSRWTALDTACDPAAVFSLTYLLTTIRVGEFVDRNYFDSGETISRIMQAFADRYHQARDAWVAGRRNDVTRPWKQAFEGGDSGTTTVLEDVFLGMNAHINYDLAVAMAQIGIVDSNGRSRKPDHDRINDVLTDVFPDVSAALAAHYDPSVAPGGVNDLTAPAVLELIFTWRAKSWVNAVLITTLPPAARPLNDIALQDAAVASALPFRTPKPPTAPTRIAFCQTHP